MSMFRNIKHAFILWRVKGVATPPPPPPPIYVFLFNDDIYVGYLNYAAYGTSRCRKTSRWRWSGRSRPRGGPSQRRSRSPSAGRGIPRPLCTWADPGRTAGSTYPLRSAHAWRTLFSVLCHKRMDRLASKEEGRAASKIHHWKFGSSKQFIIPNTAVGIFSPKAEGQRHKQHGYTDKLVVVTTQIFFWSLEILDPLSNFKIQP